MGVDYYKVLGVPKNATEDDVKKAYKKMVCLQCFIIPCLFVLS